jgi:hypothetical protein
MVNRAVRNVRVQRQSFAVREGKEKQSSQVKSIVSKNLDASVPNKKKKSYRDSLSCDPSIQAQQLLQLRILLRMRLSLSLSFAFGWLS